MGRGLGGQAVCVARVCTEPVERSRDAGAVDADVEGVDALVADPVWGCLDNVAPPAEPEPATPVRFLTRFQGILSTAPLVGLPVKACLATDLACAQPYASTITTDAGVAAFTLYHGFLGYVDVAPSDDNPDIIPALYYVRPVPDKKVVVSEELVPTANLVKNAEFAFLTNSIGKQVKTQYGHLFFGALNCQGRFAANAVLRAEPISSDTFTYYTDAAGTPSITQDKTTESGNGGYINLPPGEVTVTLRLDNGRRIGEHKVVIRKGTITYLPVGPTP